MTDRCLECDNIAVKVPMIIGEDVAHWCSDHLEDARKAALADLGQGVFNFIFSSFKHDIWFWGSDIRTTLTVAVDDYFTVRSRDLCDLGDDKALSKQIDDYARILKIKAKEYEGAIEMFKLGNVENNKMIMMWVGKDYVDQIGGPLGNDTHTIMEKYKGTMLQHDIFHHLVCLVLSAKRAERYIGHEYEEHLIGMETALWENHRHQIN